MILKVYTLSLKGEFFNKDNCYSAKNLLLISINLKCLKNKMPTNPFSTKHNYLCAV